MTLNRMIRTGNFGRFDVLELERWLLSQTRSYIFKRMMSATSWSCPSMDTSDLATAVVLLYIITPLKPTSLDLEYLCMSSIILCKGWLTALTAATARTPIPEDTHDRITEILRTVCNDIKQFNGVFKKKRQRGLWIPRNDPRHLSRIRTSDPIIMSLRIQAAILVDVAMAQPREGSGLSSFPTYPFNKAHESAWLMVGYNKP